MSLYCSNLSFSVSYSFSSYYCSLIVLQFNIEIMIKIGGDSPLIVPLPKVALEYKLSKTRRMLAVRNTCAQGTLPICSSPLPQELFQLIRHHISIRIAIRKVWRSFRIHSIGIQQMIGKTFLSCVRITIFVWLEVLRRVNISKETSLVPIVCGA
jgi:hypothetical protein